MAHVSTSSAGNGSVTSIDANYNAGTVLNLSATPNTGYVFDRWLISASMVDSFGSIFASSTTFTVSNESASIVGCFRKAPENVVNSGRYSGSSWVSVAPMYYNGTSWIECEIKRYNGSGWDNVTIS